MRRMALLSLATAARALASTARRAANPSGAKPKVLRRKEPPGVFDV